MFEIWEDINNTVENKIDSFMYIKKDVRFIYLMILNQYSWGVLYV